MGGESKNMPSPLETTNIQEQGFYVLRGWGGQTPEQRQKSLSDNTVQVLLEQINLTPQDIERLFFQTQFKSVGQEVKNPTGEIIDVVKEELVPIGDKQVGVSNVIVLPGAVGEFTTMGQIQNGAELILITKGSAELTRASMIEMHDGKKVIRHETLQPTELSESDLCIATTVPNKWTKILGDGNSFDMLYIAGSKDKQKLTYGEMTTEQIPVI